VFPPCGAPVKRQFGKAQKGPIPGATVPLIFTCAPFTSAKTAASTVTLLPFTLVSPDASISVLPLVLIVASPSTSIVIFFGFNLRGFNSPPLCGG
jgi:hypothetical protein